MKKDTHLILYHPLLATELEQYGINIPLHDDRSDRVFATLKEFFSDLEPIALQKLPVISKEDLLLCHDEDFLKRWFNDESFLEEVLIAYDCKDPSRYNEANAKKPLFLLRDSILRQVSATAYGVSQAIESGFCYYLGGGMHHGRTNQGAGFCPLSDIVIAIRKAQRDQGIGKALILDVDAHMGDGTAEVTKGDDSITTVSLHMAEGWPMGSELNIIPSDYDYPLYPGDEEKYLATLKSALDKFEHEKFDLIFVVNGADPYELDELKSSEGIQLTKEQLLARDMMIYKWARENQTPQFWVMAGGYGLNSPAIYSQFLLKVLHLVR